jgi:hypothetical protein
MMNNSFGPGALAYSSWLCQSEPAFHKRCNMALDDFLEPEVGVAVAVTAAVASPTVRKVLRRGLVYGLAGLMIARDRVAALASEVGRGAQQAVEGAAEGATKPAAEAATS